MEKCIKTHVYHLINNYKYLNCKSPPQVKKYSMAGTPETAHIPPQYNTLPPA